MTLGHLVLVFQHKSLFIDVLVLDMFLEWVILCACHMSVVSFLYHVYDWDVLEDAFGDIYIYIPDAYVNM